jgi:hypothetical protein
MSLMTTTLQRVQSLSIAPELLEGPDEARQLLRQCLEYGTGQRRALPSIDHVLVLLRALETALGERDSFRAACDDRDRVIAELLGCEGQHATGSR